MCMSVMIYIIGIKGAHRGVMIGLIFINHGRNRWEMQT